MIRARERKRTRDYKGPANAQKRCGNHLQTRILPCRAVAERLGVKWASERRMRPLRRRRRHRSGPLAAHALEQATTHLRIARKAQQLDHDEQQIAEAFHEFSAELERARSTALETAPHRQGAWTPTWNLDDHHEATPPAGP